MSKYPWLAIWGIGIVFQSLILIRGFRSAIVGKYYSFYAYIFSTLAGATLIYALGVVHPISYQKAYWALQFVTLIIGCGIILEIFRHALAPYPGAEKFSTMVVLVTFGAVFCFTILYRFLGFPSGTALFALERNVRTFQAILLFCILAVTSYYGIPIGRNLKGMISGYGLYIATSLVTLAVSSYAGPGFNRAWYYTPPLSFDVSLLIWLTALWSYHPNPAPDAAVHLEEDYEAMAARTKRALGAMRSRLAKAGRT